jgi:hypothetical protein
MVDSAVTGGVTAGLPVLMTMGAFFSISLYNVMELTVQVFTTFKRYRGLYFWSFLVATWGIAPHAIGFILKFFRLISAEWVAITVTAVGWWAMVTGQSFVLYSRLHLVVHEERWLRWVLFLITFDAIAFGVPLAVLAFGSNSSNPTPFVVMYTIWDKIQMVVFFVQEFGISVLYIYETMKLLKPSASINRKALRQLLTHLVVVNIVVLVFEITLLASQFSGHYAIQTSYKAAIYSVKLKIEFSVLNRLIELVKHKNGTMTSLDSGNMQSLGTSYRTESKTLSTIGGPGYGGSVMTSEIEDTGSRSRSSFNPNVDLPPRVMGGWQPGVMTTGNAV